MFRYYQEGDTTEWLIGVEKNPANPWFFQQQNKASRVTILAVSADIDYIEEGFAEYKGNLYFDIDHTDLSVAINSARELCDRLLSLGVDKGDLEIRLSGKKGLHIFVNYGVFTNGRSYKDLPGIYQRMVLANFYVTGVDLNVYSGGKGRMFRGTDSRRPDGKYVVLISFEELKELTVSRYHELVEAPRGVTNFSGPVVKSKALSNLFDLAKKSVIKQDKIGREVNDLSVFNNEIPNCIEALCQGKRRKDTSFNMIALNVATWSNQVRMPKTQLDSVRSRIADNCESNKAVSPARRLQSLEAMANYVENNRSKYGFYCGSILNTLSVHPCDGCELKKSNDAENASEAYCLYQKDGQYFSDRDCTVRVASFTLRREHVIANEDNDASEACTLSLHIPSRGKTIKVDNFQETNWLSKVAFKQGLVGIDGVVFTGNDNDVSRLRMSLVMDSIKTGEEVPVTYRTNKVGITYRRRRGSVDIYAKDHVGRFTYVEQDFSFNDSGASNTHAVTGECSPSPSFRFIEDLHSGIGSEANDVFGHLTRCNLPGTIATIIGWYLAAHIKTHIGLLYGQFPVLCIAGLSGTGKNSTIAVMQRMAGLVGEDALQTLEAPNATKLPFQQGLSNSTTIPRVINEMNPKSVTKHQYQTILELIKAAFDSQSIKKGRIGGGDKNGANVSTVEWRVTAPVVVLSEEPINMPAVIQRSITIMLTPEGLKKGSAHFSQVRSRSNSLIEIGKVLMLGALRFTPLKKIKILYDDNALPSDITDMGIPERVEHSYRVPLLAYDWAIEVLGNKDSGFSSENLSRLKELKQELLEDLKKNAKLIKDESSISEVDKILTEMCIMAFTNEIVKDTHYTIRGNNLWLDTLIIYPSLLKSKSYTGETLAIRDAYSFLKTVEGMPYFESNCSIAPGLPSGARGVLLLKMDELRKKNIEVEMFRT